jgi:hypothetical protein
MAECTALLVDDVLLHEPMRQLVLFFILTRARDPANSKNFRIPR